MHVFYSFIQQFHKKKKNSLQINVHINHPDSALPLVSKDVGGEAFVLLTLSRPGFQKLAQAGGRNPPPS